MNYFILTYFSYLKAPSASHLVRFVEQPPPPPVAAATSSASSSVDTSIQSAKGIKELSPEDKLKIANLIKELARYKSVNESFIIIHLLEILL